jgi:hypothetical protein
MALVVPEGTIQQIDSLMKPRRISSVDATEKNEPSTQSTKRYEAFGQIVRQRKYRFGRDANKGVGLTISFKGVR